MKAFPKALIRQGNSKYRILFVEAGNIIDMFESYVYFVLNSFPLKRLTDSRSKLLFFSSTERRTEF